MVLSDAGLDFITSFEGKLKPIGDGKYVAYKCPAGVWTIYAGCTEGVHAGMIITEEEGAEMMRHELAKHEKAVRDLVTVDLTQSQYDALVSFSYNVGTGALSKSTLLKKLNAGDYAGAAARFADWNKGGGKVLPGLVRRRAAEAEMFMKGDAAGMPQKVDQPKIEADKPLGKSGTVWGAVGTMVSGLVLLLEKTMTVVVDTIAALTTIEPLKMALLQAGANTQAIGFGALVFCGFLVIGRRARVKQEGGAP
ncbi:MAG: lysozyme [Gammaproteobacteria bacterium]|nr:lysozyme [Gammaproteobacteria bacterium]